MPRPRQTIVEYRSYELPCELPIRLLQGPQWRISPVPSARLHFHNCFEIGLCLEGSGTVQLGERCLSFREGDVLCVARNVPHTTWSAPETTSLWTYMHLDPEQMLGLDRIGRIPDLDRFLLLLSDCNLLLSPADQPWALPLLRRLVEELSQRQAGYPVAVQGLVAAFFVALSRVDTAQHPAQPAGGQLLSVSPALDYLHLHYMETFPLEVLAEACHMSPTHFRRCFHQQTGTSPLAFLHRMRVLKSCTLLRTTGASVAAVAAQVGYNSLSCYNRRFLENMGCTPTAWRGMDRDGGKTRLLTFTGWERAETSEEVQAGNVQAT